MAIAPHDPRHPDLTASDILSPQTWPKRGSTTRRRSRRNLHQDRRRFSIDDGVTALDIIGANLELLREATRTDAAFHISLDAESGLFTEIQVARGMLATGNPEQLRGQSLDALPWLQSRLAPLRVSELRDTAKPRADQSDDAALWSHLGIGSVLIIGYFIEGRPPVCSASPARGPATIGKCSCIC